jgi:diguanylate cyclase (GGDEF)-like protein/PAS domain S-box-containing protein
VAIGVFSVITLDLPLYYYLLDYTLTQVAVVGVVGWMIAATAIHLAFAQMIKLHKRSSYPRAILEELGTAPSVSQASARALDVLSRLISLKGSVLAFTASKGQFVVVSTRRTTAEGGAAILKAGAREATRAVETQEPVCLTVREGPLSSFVSRSERIAFVPVMSLQQPIGALVLLGKKADGDLRDDQLLMAIGRALGLSLYSMSQREELADTAKRLQTLVTNAPVVIFATDSRGVFSFIEGKALETLKVDPGSICGRSFDKVYADYPAIASDFNRALAGVEVANMAEVAHNVFEYRISPVRDEEGKVAGVIGLAWDITERERARHALETSERRFRTLTERSSDGIAMIDGKGVVTYSGPSVERILGYTVEEFVGMNVADIFHPNDLERCVKLMEDLLKQPGGSLSAQFRLRHKNGEWRWIESIGTNLLDEPDIGAIVVNYRDISERKAGEDALRQSEARFRAIFRDAAIGIAVVDAQGHPVETNAAVQGMLGYSAEELRQMTFAEFTHPEDIAADLDLFRQLVAGKRDSYQMEKRFVRKDGSIVWGRLTASAVRDDHGRMLFGIGMVEDITERKRTEEALRESEERYRDLFENATDIVFTHDFNGRFLAVNRVMERVTGYTREELLSLNVTSLVAPEYHGVAAEYLKKIYKGEDMLPYEIEIIGKDGRRIPLEVSERILYKDGRPVLVQGIARDIRERKRAEQAIRQLAFHDALTGLPNRMLFEDRLRMALSRAQREKSMLAVMFLDLDRFKVVNDTLGHSEGDRLLQAVASDLTKLVREGDTVARVGGDEFTILLPEIDRIGDAVQVAERILETLKQPRLLGEQEFRVTASIGVTAYPDDGADVETLLRNADTAMYRAKERGRDNYQLYTRAMNANILERLALERDLWHALEREEMKVWYQPIVDIATDRIVGAEALVRWLHPERGTVLPEMFVPLAEETDLIVPLGEWVLRHACRWGSHWNRFVPHPVRITVNISARQLQQGNFVEVISRALLEAGMDSSLLQLEITEGAVMKNVEPTVRMLTRLQQMGVQIAVDDFGTGYSSLSYLKRLPIDAVKIDRSFVRDIANDSNDAAIVTSVITMAHNLGLKVIAEGVETEEQLEFLRRAGCDEFQGYLFSRAMRPGAFERLLLRGPKKGDGRPSGANVSN